MAAELSKVTACANRCIASGYKSSDSSATSHAFQLSWKLRLISIYIYVLLLCGVAIAGKGRRGRLGRMGRDGQRWRQRCPVMPPCYCDFGVSRYGRTKRIVCGQLEHDFPTFADSREVLDCVTLMYTELSHIPPEGFANIRASMIDLQGNNFGDRINEKAFARISRNLESLNLAWSNITQLPAKVFRSMLQLRNVTLAENKLRQLSPVLFVDLRSLEKLSLAGNPLGNLPAAVFRYQTNLMILDLGYCALQGLPSTVFAGLWNLAMLDLRGNAIHQLTPAIFEDLWSLKELLLSHNPLETLRMGDFRGLSNLERLELKEGLLRTIEPGTFGDTIRLDTLDLGDNLLIQLGPGVLGIPSVEWLSLDGNGLTELPRDVATMSELIYLDLSYNNLETLDRCIFYHLHQLEYINLRQNPFNCNCDLIWLRTLEAKLFRHWEYTRLLPFVPGHCARPAVLRGLNVTSWGIERSCPRSGRAYTPCWEQP